MGTSTVDRARNAAHRNATEIGQADLVAALNKKLGPKLVAFIADRNPTTIARWEKGPTVASEEALRPLRVAYQIIKLLERKEADATIRAWFMGMNPQLEDAAPAEAIRDGDYRETIAAARAFMAGG